ncbi:hypothetical protein D3C78_710280 [compost metagenome]
MAERVQVKEITEWMSVDKYHQFDLLTVEEILGEIEFRTIFLSGFYPKEDEAHDEWKALQTSILKQIQAGAIVSADISDTTFQVYQDASVARDKEASEPIEFLSNGMPVMSAEHHLKKENPELSEDEAIQVFNMADLVTYYRHFVNVKVIEHGHRTSTINKGKIFSSVSADESGNEYFEGEVVIKVNLASYTDDDLLSEFKELLKSWRREVGFPEPEPSKSRVGISSLKKIAVYKVIPFLDLLLWEMVNDRRISNELIARVLFPLSSDSDVIGGSQIKDTIRPFVERFVYDNALQQVKFYTKKNDYLKSMRLSDVMKLSED